MPTGIRKCKICGCEYPYCKTVTQDKFRYQDVACSPEHAAEYFRKIEESRLDDINFICGLTEDTFEEDFDDEDSDGYDEFFEEDFDDEDSDE